MSGTGHRGFERAGRFLGPFSETPATLPDEGICRLPRSGQLEGEPLDWLARLAINDGAYNCSGRNELDILIDIGSQRKLLLGGEPVGIDSDMNRAARRVPPLESTVVARGQTVRDRRLEKRAIGPLRPRPEQPDRSVRNRLAAKIDDSAPARVGPGKGQVDAARSGPNLHRLNGGAETWGLGNEIQYRPRFDPEREPTMVVRRYGRDGITVSPPLAVEDLGAGHGLAIGRPDRPIDARSASVPEGR
jgi:hypothetical protein